MDMISASLHSLFFRKTIRTNTSEIVINSDMIRLLVAIDENKDMAEVSAETGMGTALLRSTLLKLLELGLIENVVKSGRYLDITFYNIMSKNLIHALGPFAEYVLEDIMADMSLSSDNIPIHRAADLIGRVGEQIPDHETRIRFEDFLLKIIPA